MWGAGFSLGGYRLGFSLGDYRLGFSLGDNRLRVQVIALCGERGLV